MICIIRRLESLSFFRELQYNQSRIEQPVFYRVSAADALDDTHILKQTTGKHCCFPVLRLVFDFAAIPADLDVRFDLSGMYMHRVDSALK